MGILTKLLENHQRQSGYASRTVIFEAEKDFHGVSLSQLSLLAQSITKGTGCYMDSSGYLVFKYESNGGHQLFYSQMKVNSAGKLVRLNGNYPGQVWSPADEFVEIANQMFQFEG